MSQYTKYPVVSGSSTGVTSVNSLTGALTLAAGTGITLTPAGNTLTIASTGGTGTVTSVGLTVPGVLFSIAGSPVTTSGTLAFSLLTQSANRVFAGPTSGGAATPTFRSLVAADLPVGNLTDVGTDGITITGGTGAIIGAGGVTISQHVADTTHNGFLSAADWNTFNNKLDASRINYITNPDAEDDTSGWNLYDNAGRTASAFVVEADITWTAVASGNPGNGININYIFHATQSYLTPLVTVVSPTQITIAWYNGPTIANNPTATQMKAAFDAVPGAVALVSCAITGTASNKQYITGSHVTAQGGDTSPTTGSGGVPTGLTLTRSTVNPLVGAASFLLTKNATNQQGTGLSTDFATNAADKGNPLQISFYYSADAGAVLGSSSDTRVFLYDITNAVMLPITPLATLTGPTASTIYRFAAQFTASSTSVNYRLIFHTATTNATAWNLQLDGVVVNSVLDATTATQVESVVLLAQPISAGVNNTNGPMAVAKIDGATSWVPATASYNGDFWGMFGFASNIVGLTADITVRGACSGFSLGPFAPYNWYVDPTSAGNITPTPASFPSDRYVIMGKGIDSETINVQPFLGQDLITSKGGLLGNAGANNGTGDQVLAVGTNGNVLVANSAASLGFNWAPAVVAGTGLTYTTATRALTLSNLAGDVTGAPGTNTIAAATVTGKALTGYVSGSGTVAATDTILTAINKLNGNDGLKAPLASPTFTGDINSSTGNVLVSTIGKGLQVKTGTNAKIGTATLVAGTVTVANTSVTANSRIFVCINTDGGTPGDVRVSAKVVGTSFTITSSSGADTSSVAWHIIESIP